jgi:glycosyltransferase involved in cell wall biosynthesis
MPMSLSRRILFVTEGLGIGGTENHLLELLPCLKAKGFDVAAFCFTEPGLRINDLEAAGIPVVSPQNLGSPQKQSLMGVLRISLGAAQLFALIRSWRPVIVHFFLPGPYLAGAPVAIAARVPIKLMSRRSLSDYQEKWPGAARIERQLHRHMDVVLGNSRSVIRELVAKEGCPESQVRLIYNGVRLPTGNPTRKEARAALGLAQEGLVATVVANLFPYKGHLDLIAALAGVCDQLPQRWTLLCAGRDGGSGPEIAHAIDDAGLGERIRLLGERSDIPLLLKASDFGILAPKGNEGFSNAVLEFMASGLPMVVTDVGGNAEAVTDGETGLVVPPHDPPALGAAILRLAHDAELRRTMGEQGKKRAAGEFSSAASIDQYCALYEELLARKPDYSSPLADLSSPRGSRIDF